jgi:hypothetical protein
MKGCVPRGLVGVALVAIVACHARATPPGTPPSPPTSEPTVPVLQLPANLVQNGGFETGMFSPEWTLTPGGPFDQVCMAGNPIGATTCIVHSGQFAMSFGLNGGADSLTQNIPTVPGRTYTLSFFLANNNPLDQSTTTFAVLWNGNSVYSLPSPQPTFPFRQVFITVTATTTSTPLTFAAQQDPSQWFLDDVSLQQNPPAAVPTLMQWAIVLLTLLLAGVAAWQIRRRRGLTH